MLYKLGQLKPFKPARYFSIDRVFRNESLDATHLAEFHQVEGTFPACDAILIQLEPFSLYASIGAPPRARVPAHAHAFTPPAMPDTRVVYPV